MSCETVTVVVKVVLSVLVLAICAFTAPLAAATRGAEQLTITVRGGEFGDRLYTLGCDPATGTVRKPADACATLHAHPDLLQPHPGEVHHCPSGRTYEIAGTSDGTAVAASFSLCVNGQEDGLVEWDRLVGYAVPALRGHPVLKLDAGIGPLRLGQRVEAVEHGTRGQLLGEATMFYRFAGRGWLVTHYGSDLRVDRIEPAFSGIDFGRAKVKRWRHFDCRPGRVYRHSAGATWTAVVVEPGERMRGWRVVLGAGAVPKTCGALNLAPLPHGR